MLFADSRGRGVIGKILHAHGFFSKAFVFIVCYATIFKVFFLGVLEANFIEPTHNKQDFEKTSLFQKLVARLKEMTWEYW